MKLATAEIRESVSLGEDGSFFAYIRGIGKRQVIYTSPFKAGEKGGFVFPPLALETILVCQPDDETQLWFYLSTVYRAPQGKAYGGEVTDERKQQILKVDKDIYKSKGIPMKWVMSSPGGHRIVFSEDEGKKPEGVPTPSHSHGGELNVDLYEEEWENKRLEILSAKGKALKFLDSKDQNCIYLINEHRDGIKITSGLGNPTSAARSIEIEALGPLKNISREGQIDIWVDDGREINVINNSTGAWGSMEVDETPNYHGAEEHYGNINLESKFRDINIQSMAPGGRVFIMTPSEAVGGIYGTPGQQKIEIETRGEDSVIRIYSKNNIQIRAETGGIDMACKGDFLLNCDGVVNINGKQGVNIDSGPEQTGGEIHLNSGRANAVLGYPVDEASDPVIMENKDDYRGKTYYDDKGVFEQE